MAGGTSQKVISGQRRTTSYGTVLLAVYQKLFYSLILAVAGPPAVLLSLLNPASSLPIGLRILAFPFGVLLTVAGVRKLQRRPLMMECTDQGIMIHAKADGVRISNSLLRDLFVPWQRIESMYYLTDKEVQAQGLRLVSGGWGTSDPLMVIRARMDGLWPSNGTLRHDLLTRNARPGEIYLKVIECSPGEIDLWEQVRAIARHYGVSTPEH